ncbi:MAG: glycoside hydrolase family 5 protein [Treponema sp.]|nr:glycoside hydrolase family 5 protein [Treponema sp.]
MKKMVPFFVIFTLDLCINLSCKLDDNGKKIAGQVPGPFNISAMDFVSNMKVGWNLGNTLDATVGNLNSPITQLEAGWVGIATTKENIDTLKNAGFNVIRIPVSWSKAADSANNYAIRSDWMLRVTRIVDWAIENDMYVIINTHHDSGDQGTIFRFLDSNVEGSLVRFTQIWKQIAENFKWYGEKLIFEPLNEPRTGSDWAGTPEQYNNINRHYQAFVDLVRASGENNRYRFLLFNTYAASRNPAPMNGLILPEDSVKDKFIVSYHAYVPGVFCFPGRVGDTDQWSEEGRSGRDALDITEPMDRFHEKFVQNGIPVIIGEFGAVNKDNAAERQRWVEYYTKAAWDRGMRVILWDNAQFGSGSSSTEYFGLLDRRTNQFIYPELLAGLLNGSK